MSTFPNSEDSLRASNADREQIAQRLHAAFGEGRLEVDELDSRLKAAYAAKTVGDLRPLLADLPGAGWQPEWPAPAAAAATPATGPASRSRAPARRGRGADVALRVNAQAWLTVVLLNVVIWAVVCIGAREVIYFWPIWVAGPWGAVLL